LSSEYIKQEVVCLVSNFTLKVSSILGVTAVLFLLDWFYMNYLTSHGLDIVTQPIGVLNMSLPLQWLPVLGVVLLSLVTWYEAYYAIFPRRGLEANPLGQLRLVRAIVFSVALFVWVLFIPELVGSNWFWSRLGDAAKSIAAVRGFGVSLLGSVESLMGLSLLWQYSFSQVMASAAMVFGALVLARSVRRTRKTR
jgi:formate/nitrite transporter FocA (FNT family)